MQRNSLLQTDDVTDSALTAFTERIVVDIVDRVLQTRQTEQKVILLTRGEVMWRAVE